jgi:predicted DNA-binding transcriptional regulator YafY
MLLVKEKKTTAKDLAIMFEVTTRTIYRDIDDLTLAGIPLYTTKGKNGGIFLDDEYILNKTHVTSDEQSQILFALKTICSIPNIDDSHVLSKVTSLFSSTKESHQHNWLEVDFSPWNSYSASSNKIFNTIKTAITRYKTIEIEYSNTKGENKSVELLPLKLLFKDKHWYLIACSDHSHESKMYKLNRITYIKITERQFSNKLLSDTTYSYTNDYIDYNKLSKVSIHLSKSISFKVYDDFDRDFIKVHENHIEIEGLLEINDWLISKILSFGENVYAIQPQNLKSLVKSSARKLLTNL